MVIQVWLGFSRIR